MSIFKKKTPSAQKLLGIDEITEHSIRTPNGELVYGAEFDLHRFFPLYKANRSGE